MISAIIINISIPAIIFVLLALIILYFIGRRRAQEKGNYSILGAITEAIKYLFRETINVLATGQHKDR